MSTTVIACCFVVALLFLTANTSWLVPGRGMMLLRVLFPSWRFFEELTEIPYLELRWARGGESLGSWQPALRRPSRRWSALLLNPEVNLALAEQSLLQQLESDISELQPGTEELFVASPSYRLCRALVLFQLQQLRSGVEPVRFQFRVSRLFQGAAVETCEPFLVSVVEEV